MGIFISIDMGGTQIRAATYPQGSTEPLNIRKTPTRSGDEAPFERMCALIQAIWPKGQTVESITVALPGPLDPVSGVIFSAPNIPGWENFPLRDALKARFHVPVHIGNDANLAALGEWRYGAGKGHHDLLYLTISTGIGGGVISGDRLLLGTRGLASELGHLTVLSDGPLCGCGQRGHLETISAGPGIARYVKEQIEAGRESSLQGVAHITAKEVSQAAREGDPLSVEAFTRAGTYLGVAVADFLHIFNPSIVIFGGGVSFSGDILFKPMREALQQHVMDASYLHDLQIATAALGDEAGLMGALALAELKKAEG
jgi:glucokinase